MKKQKSKIDEIALVFVVAVIAIVISIYDRSNGDNPIERGKLTTRVLEDNFVVFASDGIINQYELDKIQNTEYEQLKKSLNVKNDFCIYIEDENGNIILAKGSSKLSRDGIYCNE